MSAQPEATPALAGAAGSADSAWPARDIVRKLVEAADILLDVYDYDGDGWEQIHLARSEAHSWAESPNSEVTDNAPVYPNNTTTKPADRKELPWQFVQGCVTANFARTLERELVSAIADRDLYKRLSDERFSAIVEGAAVLRATRAELAEWKQMTNDYATRMGENLARAKTAEARADRWEKMADELEYALRWAEPTPQMFGVRSAALAAYDAAKKEEHAANNPT